MLDRKYGNNFMDAHFPDAMQGDEAEAVERVMAFHAAQQFTLLLPYSVKDEMTTKTRLKFCF